MLTWLSCSCRYATLEEVAGKVAEVAQDQNGCRFLQKKFDEGGPAAISMVFAVRALRRARCGPTASSSARGHALDFV